jgi:6-methylsalicylate decarboxylase
LAASNALPVDPDANEASNPRRIDVHHHMLPPEYASLTRDRILEITSGDTTVLKWTPEVTLEQMEQFGVASAILSLPVPGAWYEGKENSRKLARISNEYGARLSKDYPGRFGMFAALPLPDVDGSLAEIQYAFDSLAADGAYLQTSYDDKWPGDPAFAPVFDELNRRKAIVFVHPTMSCCGNPMPGVSPPTIEFPMDSTRTITSLLFSGGFARYADTRFIFSHGGGMLLPIVQRLYGAAAQMKPEERAIKMPKGPEYELTRQHYELASIGFNPAGVAGLRKLVPNSQLLYGSDEPFLPTVQMAGALQKLDFSADELAAVQRDNAVRLFARLQT